MLFDLWGRGYSDSVDLPHDSRLYTTEILLAITSSPIAWVPEGFSLIGYSLGGGICADFTAAFPEMVKSLVRTSKCFIFPWRIVNLFHMILSLRNANLNPSDFARTSRPDSITSSWLARPNYVFRPHS